MMSSMLPILFLLSLPLKSSSLSFHHRVPRCEVINEPACQGKYTHTMMPNILGHDDQEEASMRFHEFDPLIESSCSKQLKFFLCSLHFPLCVPQIPEAIPACRAMCEHVRDRCAPKMRLFQFDWPETINCSLLPEHTEKVRKCLHPDHPDDQKDNVNDEPTSLDDVKQPAVDDEVTIDVDRDTSRGERKQQGKKKKRAERRGKEAKDDAGRSEVIEYEVEVHEPDTVNREQLDPVIVNHEDVVTEEEEDGDWLEHLPDAEQEVESSLESSWIPKFPDVDDDELDTGYNIQQGSPHFFQNDERNLQRCVNPDKFHYVVKMEKCLPLCDADTDVLFSSSDKFFAYFWMLTCSLLCLVSSALTVGTFLIDSKRFRYPERPIIFLSLCYLLYSVGFLVRLGGGPTGSVSCVTKDDVSYVVKGDLESTGCTAVFFLLYYFGMAASVWWVILSVTWFLAAGMKWGHEAIESYGFYFHLVAWLLPAVQTIVVLVTGKVDGDELTGMCYVGNLDPDALLYYVIVPLTSYLAIGAIALGSGFGSLFKIRRVILTKSGEKDAGKLEKLMLKIGIFSVLYLVPTACVVAVNVYQYKSYNDWMSKADTWACNPPGFKNNPYSPYARYHRNAPELPQSREDVYPFALYGDYYEGGVRFYDPRIPHFVPYVDPDGRYVPRSNDYGSMGYRRRFQDPDKRGSFSGGNDPATEAVVGPGGEDRGLRPHDTSNYESRTIYNGVNLFRFNPSAYVQPDGTVGYYGDNKHPLPYSSEVRRAFDAYAANVDVIDVKRSETATEKIIARDCRLAESIPSFPIFAIKIFMSLLVGITSGIWVWSGKTYLSWKVFCSSCWCKKSKRKTIEIASNTPPITSSGNVNAPPSVTSQLLRKCTNSEQIACPGSNRYSEPIFTAEDRLLPSARSIHDTLPHLPEKYYRASSVDHRRHLDMTDSYHQHHTEDDFINHHGNATYVVTSQKEVERSRSCFKQSRKSRDSRTRRNNGRRPASSGRLNGLTDQSNRAVPNAYEDASVNRERVNRRHENGSQKHFVNGKKRVRNQSDSEIKKLSLVSEGGFKPMSTSSRREANSVNIGTITSL